MPRPLRLAFDRVLPTRDVHAAWRAFSDTDRFNRDAKLGFAFSEEVDEHGRVHRFGEVKRMGMTLRWEDEPFQIEVPTSLVSARRFQGGPLARLVTTITLREGNDGVALRYVVELTPSHPLLRWIVAIDAALSIRPMLTRVIDQTAARLGEHPASPSPSPQTLQALGEIGCAERLATLIDHGDPRDVDRLRPLALAAEWDLPPEQVLTDFLRATAHGGLEIRYDLLCPSCHGPKVRLTDLDLSAVEPHCPSCRIRYDGTLADSIEVSFKPTPAVRALDVQLDCINSPVHTPHVRSRLMLSAGARTHLSLSLEPGAFVLRPGTDGTPASIEVRTGLRAQNAAIEINAAGLAPQILRLGPGKAKILLYNRTDEAVYIQLEQRWRPPHALPLGRLLEHPDAPAVVDTDPLPAGLELRHLSCVVLAVEGVDSVDAVLSPDLHGTGHTIPMPQAGDEPVWSFHADGCAVLAYPTVADALRIAARAPLTTAAMLLDQGDLGLFSNGTQELPLGPLAERIFQRLRRVGVGRLAVSAEVDEHELSQARLALDLPLLYAEGEPFSWIARADPPAPPPDTSPYVLSGEIARGGMGAVYASTHPQTGEPVAIKVLLPEFAADPSYLQRFYYEASLTARLDHPHTVRVLDVGARDRGAYLVMERLVGEELTKRMSDDEPVELPVALALILPVLDALAAAHDQGIVHRDIKPANVFVCAEPTADLPKVLDFGVAFDVSDELDPRAPILGTPRYLAPEQVERLPLDGRVDQYAIGLVLYEMLSGSFPFKGDTVHQLAMMRLAVDPTPLHQIAPHVPEPIARVVMRALAVEPADRWPSARAMADALREAAAPSAA